MARCDSDGKLLPHERFKPGDEVVMKMGPVSNAIATIESVSPDRRVWVLMDIMGGRTRVGVQAD